MESVLELFYATLSINVLKWHVGRTKKQGMRQGKRNRHIQTT